MAFDLLAEVKRLEKQVKDVLSGMAVASKGKPLPPQAARLCGLSETLAEVRTSIEKANDPAPSPDSKSSDEEGEWGTAFQAEPPKPSSALDGGPEDVAEAWVYEDAAKPPPTKTQTGAPGADPGVSEPPEPPDDDDEWSDLE